MEASPIRLEDPHYHAVTQRDVCKYFQEREISLGGPISALELQGTDSSDTSVAWLKSDSSDICSSAPSRISIVPQWSSPSCIPSGDTSHLGGLRELNRWHEDC